MATIGIMMGEEDSSRAEFCLDEELAKKVKALSPGQAVKITLTGKVECLSFREGETEGGYRGKMEVELAELKVGPAAPNAISELLDEDE